MITFRHFYFPPEQLVREIGANLRNRLGAYFIRLINISDFHYEIANKIAEDVGITIKKFSSCFNLTRT